jgi:hypothetical protein
VGPGPRKSAKWNSVPVPSSLSASVHLEVKKPLCHSLRHHDFCRVPRASGHDQEVTYGPPVCDIRQVLCHSHTKVLIQLQLPKSTIIVTKPRPNPALSTVNKHQIKNAEK